jgi:hypothetical protein
MAEDTQISLIAGAKAHWRVFFPAWIFPLVFLFGSAASERHGYRGLFFLVVAAPLFFWSFFRAMGVCRTGQLSYWHTVFWGMLVPFIIWVLAVYSRLFVLHLLGANHEV